MRRLLTHISFFRCAICGTVALLNLFHPLFHSFDGGTFDAVMVQLDMLAASLAPMKVD